MQLTQWRIHILPWLGGIHSYAYHLLSTSIFADSNSNWDLKSGKFLIQFFDSVFTMEILHFWHTFSLLSNFSTLDHSIVPTQVGMKQLQNQRRLVVRVRLQQYLERKADTNSKPIRIMNYKTSWKTCNFFFDCSTFFVLNFIKST